MNKITHIAIILCLAGCLIILTGCNETHAQRKKEMVRQWEKSTSSAQLPAIESLIEQGQIEKAKRELTNCIQANPELPSAYLLIGRIHFIEGRNELACQSFEQAIDLDPELDQAWHLLGSLAILDKDYERALECCQRAVELMPVKTDYILSLSDVYIETDQLEQAQQTISQALSRQPQNLELMLSKARLLQQTGQTDQAIQLYEQAQIMHGNKPEILEPAGYAYSSRKNWAKAAEKFELLVKQYPENDPRYHVIMRSLARCLFNAKQYASALFWYDKLSVVYREDVDIWLNMAQAALELNDASRAAYCANKAIKIKPSCPQAHAILGCAHYIQGRYTQSLEAFYKIADDEQLGGFAWFMSGRCYQKQGRNRQANIAFERAEELDPDNELIASFLDKTVHPL